MAAAWRRALADAPGRFRDIADHPATVRALADAHTELRDISGTALAAVRDASDVGHDLVALHESVTTRLGDDWYDVTDVIRTAAAQLRGAPVPAELGTCVLYLPQLLSRAEAEFVTTLADRADLTVVVGVTRVKRADRAVDGSLERIGLGAVEMPKMKPATATRVLTASDSDDEVRCVVREVVETLKSTPAHRVAVLYAGASPYARLLHEHLAEADIKINGPGVRPVDERAVARTLIEILALVDHDVPRAGLFQALANAPVRDFTGDRIPVSPWERVSRSAGVVGGSDWTARLDSFINGKREQAAAEETDLDSREWLVKRFLKDAGLAGELREFATTLRDELHRADGMSTWHDLATWCRELFTTLVGSDTTLSKLPAEEQYAAATVVSLLRGLESLDAVDGSATLATLRDVIELELAGSLPRVGRFGEGVLVAPVSAAIGLDLDVVFVVGLSEDLYPGRLRADALLPERTRAATDGELVSSRERLNSKQRHLLVAFASAGVEAVASLPRGDLRRSAQRLPSRWLLPTLREMSGDKNLAATAWEEPLTYDGQLAAAGSFAGELLHTDRLATDQEWRTRKTAYAGELDCDAVVVAGAQMARAREADPLSRYDGNLTGEEGLPDYATEDRSVSPTTLEEYASCPHSFFVHRLLGVKEIEQPEDIVKISPLEIGNLIHQSVEALVTEFSTELPDVGQPWSDAQLDRFLEIIDAKADEFERRGLTGHPRLWAVERERIRSDARWLLDDDNEWRAEVGARVAASELVFGSKGIPPVEIAVPGGRIRMRGSADKVDVGRDGTIYVTDIKTGSDRKFTDITQDDPLAAGSKLQLPVYAYAARIRFGERDTPVHAAYWFVRRDRGRREIDLTPGVERIYADTLSVLVTSIARGLFPMRAPDSPDYTSYVQCSYCNPDGLGYTDNRKLWERKRNDPVLRDLLTLIEAEALTQDEVGA
jgi:RecB family exonuclease